MIVEGIGKHLVTLVVIVALFGVVFGWASADIEVLNPKASEAAANQAAVMTAYVAEKNRIDLSVYREEQMAKLEAEKGRIASDLATYRKMNEVKVNLAHVGGIALIIVPTYAAMAALTLYFWSRFQNMVNRKEEALQASPHLTQVYLRRYENGNGRSAPRPHTHPSHIRA